MTEAQTVAPNYIDLTANIVVAYVSHNSVPADELPGLVRSVHAAVSESATGKSPVEEIRAVVPAVPIKKSITDEYLISLEDGKRYKALKRHLSGRGLTPEQYREKYDLPRDYPMVAPSYAKKRSELAKTIGLGRMRMGHDTKSAPPPQPKPRGRGKKAA